MTQVKLNKSALSLQQKNLKNYERYLPSLELKRKKLLSVRVQLDEQIKHVQAEELRIKETIQNDLPMASAMLPQLGRLISIQSINVHEENIVGAKVPVFGSVEFNIKEYAYLNTPHWFETAIALIRALVELGLQIKLLLSAQEILAGEIKTVTQRKNLFEKVLIPEALKQIRLIQIFLSDNERAGVVSSKIAKRKRPVS